MKRKKAAKRPAKPGKYAGRSLHVTVPATAANPGNIREALANAEAGAAEVLGRLRYATAADAKPGSTHWAAALATESRQSAGYRAAQRMMCIRDCRTAISAGDAEGAAWAAYVLAEVGGRDNLDAVAEPVLRDRARQGGTGKGGRTKRTSATSAWQAATAAAVKALGTECAAKEGWRWLDRQTPVSNGTVTMEGGVLTFDGSDATLTFNAWRRYLTKELAKLRNK